VIEGNQPQIGAGKIDRFCLYGVEIAIQNFRSGHLCLVELCTRKSARVDVSPQKASLLEAGLAKVTIKQMSVTELRASQVRRRKIASDHVHVEHATVPEPRAKESGLMHPGFDKNGVVDPAILQVSFCQVGSAEIHLSHCGSSKIGILQIRAAQV
jgi:hypothetical protein